SEVLTREDAGKLAVFAQDFLASGNGALTIAAPAGPDAAKVVGAIGEQLVDDGVPRTRILVSQQEEPDADGKVGGGYIRSVAHTTPSGNWPVNAADTEDNLPMPNWGCSVQQNLAAQIADPRDLVQPRGTDASDSTRRMQVLNKYEQGQTTASQKTAAQSAA